MSLCYTPGAIGKSHDPDFSGLYEIVTDAAVFRVGTPGVYRTRLYGKKRCATIDSVTSGQDGTYRFTHLNGDSTLYFVVAFDNEGGAENMAASDSLVLSLMAVPVF
jgi:hypothetical protein